MDPRKQFYDQRNRNLCFSCGKTPDTKDHVPSKVFLDKPYPQNLPSVDCCKKCNVDFSEHEQYFSCLLECAIHGSTDPELLSRKKIIRTLERSKKLRSRIDESKLVKDQNTYWEPEWERIKKIILKLARGHLTYETGDLFIHEPSDIQIQVLHLLSSDELQDFIAIPEQSLFPEIGSFAHINFGGPTSGYGKWKEIQKDNYVYAVGQDHGSWVKLIISNYIAFNIKWL